MLNRRHLRIKILQSLYAYFQSEDDNYPQAEKNLFGAIDKIYHLYIYLLLAIPEVKCFAERKIEENKKKIRPTEDDLNPNLKFVNNAIIQQIETDQKLIKTSETEKINWIGDEKQEMFRKMFLTIRESETYFEHINNGNTDFEADKQFLIDLFKEEIANSPLLYNFFEEESINWLDDIDFACSMVLKTIKSVEENKPLQILDLYKDEEDEKEFTKELFKNTILLDKETEALIDDLTKNWELDRIAKMDIILMKMAITEFQIFNTIPTKVTLNEYIEISKFYSTPKSNSFINGILDRAIVRLNAEGKIKKIGRGLLN
ncbi:MAG: transcription antitermination protein NusB [Crocinitomicaceae bacterium]|nr:transcription antitermination protein NusB [Crocinitomicaceae bacterium]